MKLIMENWKRFLTEIGGENIATDPRIQKSIDKFFEIEGLGIHIEQSGKDVAIKYVHLKGDYMSPVDGYVNIEKRRYYAGPCLDGWTISRSESDKGWGPLLYEIAMEWASRNGGGLTPDRQVVSDLAKNVWYKYESRDDIIKTQLDAHKGDELKQLTPDDESDDCIQWMASKDASPNDWTTSPFSKMYSKNNLEVITHLLMFKKLLVNQGR
jgi:hypothetical protein